MTAKKSKVMLHIPGETALAFTTIAALAGVTPEQAMAVALAVQLIKFVGFNQQEGRRNDHDA